MLTKKDTKTLFSLALPLILSGLVEASLGFTSTIFISRLGADTLAAGALVSWFFATLMVVLWGLLTALSVPVSHCLGSGKEHHIAHVMHSNEQF